MAAGEHRRSRFRCLTLARIVAASVVALAFAATVVVVVLTAVQGLHNVSLTVTHGHIQSDGPLWSTQDFKIEHLRRRRNEIITFYKPAAKLTVWVSMDAHDWTRHTTTVCVFAVHVLDMPHAPSFDGMVQIATIRNTVATGNAGKPCAPWRHRGSSSSTMQLDRWITIDDPLMLCYISQKYGGVNDFTVMLKVDMILYPKKDGDTPPAFEYDTHYCWPVTIGNTRRISAEAVTCKSSHAIDYAPYVPVLNACNLTSYQRQICNKWGRGRKVPDTCV